jgi:tetratricopeptide (TPR) repeat protein
MTFHRPRPFLKTCFFVALLSAIVHPIYAEETKSEPIDAAILKRYKVVPGLEVWRKTLYIDKQFRQVEEYAAAKLKAGDEKSRYELGKFYLALIEIESDVPVAAMIATLQEWERQQPQLHIPRMIRGYVFIQWAWEARGTGWGKDITPEKGRKMSERISVAKRCLEKAHAQNPKDPYPSAGLVNASLLLGSPRSDVEKYFQSALSADPGNFIAHLWKLDYLMPKWFGSKEEMLAFADEAKRNTAYPRLGFVWLAAQRELHRRSQDKESSEPDPYKNPEIWKEMEAFYRSWLADRPDAVEARANFAFDAHRAGNYPLAAEQFDLIGDRFPTPTLWGSIKNYNYARGETYAWVGQGYEQRNDLEQAKVWYKRAVALGSSWAMNRMGMMFRDGLGVTRNDVEAVKLFQAAAAKGNEYAMANLGIMYQTGRGIAVNVVEAERLYDKAGKTAKSDVLYNIAHLFYTGKEIPKDYVHAMQFYALGAAKGDPKAMNTIGIMYESGYGVKQDYKKAIEWYEKAAAQGHVKARERVALLKSHGY